jgi:hypothetical protein
MLQSILDILDRDQTKITDDSDVAWTRYESPAALRAELASYIEQLNAGNTDFLNQLNHHFLPTSTFQEHAISNGWVDEYMELSEAFDNTYASFQSKQKAAINDLERPPNSSVPS